MSFWLMPIAIFYLICSIIGIIGNAVMIFVFIKEKKFKLPCNYLITLNCLADLLHLSGHFVFNYQVFMKTTMTQAECYSTLFFCAIGVCISGPLLLSIGFDRLFACQFPVGYRNTLDKPKLYIFGQLIFPVTFTAVLMILGYLWKDDKTQLTCMVPLALPMDAFQIFTYASIIINLLILIIYLRTFSLLNRYTEQDASKLRRIFKSIFLTVILVLIGWCTVTIGNTVAISFIKDNETRELASIYAGIGVNLSCACNVFVFYAINSEYRHSIRVLLHLAKPHEFKSSSVDMTVMTGKRMSLAITKGHS